MRTLKLLVALIVATTAACGSPDDDGRSLDTLAPPPTGEVQDPPPSGASTSTSDAASGGPVLSTTSTTAPLGAPSTGSSGSGSTSASTVATGTGRRPGSTSETTRVTETTGEAQASTTTRVSATTQPSGPTATTSPTTTTSRAATTTTPPKQAQTISFAQPSGPWAYGESKSVVATASSGLPVSYNTSGACVVENALLGVVRASDVGECSITASQQGDGAWKAATPVTRSVTISKATPAISGFTNQVREYPQDYFSLALTATSYPGAVITYGVVAGNDICTVTGATLDVTIDPNSPPSLPATCDVKADVKASQLFEAASATARFTVNPTVLTIRGSASLVNTTVQVDVTLNYEWDISVTATCGSPEDQYDDLTYSFSFEIDREVNEGQNCTITIGTVTRDQTHEDATLTLTVP